MDNVRRLFIVWVVFAVLTTTISAQGLKGSLAGTVKDEQGGALANAVVRVTSPAIIGGEEQRTTNARGQWRFLNLPPGTYALTVELPPRFATYPEEGIHVGGGEQLERHVVLKLASVTQSVNVNPDRRLDSWSSGIETRFGPNYLGIIPSRRDSMFDPLRSALGISPTSPSSGTVRTVSDFGSGINENLSLIDDNNYTCVCHGASRAEPSVDVIQEIHVQSIGASVEFGNMQGGVFNIITKQGGARFQYDASYYGQFAGLTSQPVVLPVMNGKQPSGYESGYERNTYRDFTTNLGGPILRDRMWFFGGYQYLRDYDSQPGADPASPRNYEQNKLFGKLTWKLTPSMHLMHSYHQELWVNPTLPTLAAPFETTQRVHASVPAMTLANFTHAVSNNTVWEARASRFMVHQKNDPSSGDRTTPPHSDSVTGTAAVNASQIGSFTLERLTMKAVLNRYQSGWIGADHNFKVGTQFERGSHRSPQSFPGGVQYIESNGAPSQRVERAPWTVGGQFTAAAAFASDSFTVKDRVTIDAGVRYDYNRAVSPDLPSVDAEGNETSDITPGLGTLYETNVFLPRVGASVKLTGDGRTMFRATYGRYAQGVLTGELDPFHPGLTRTTTMAYEAATNNYTRLVSVVDPTVNLSLDRHIVAPRTDEGSVTFEREITPEFLVSASYIRKRGTKFIAWMDTGGLYKEERRTFEIPDAPGSPARVIELPVFVLTNTTADRRFLLTNQEDHFLHYDGLALSLDKRLSKNWQASGSYTFSRTYGRQVTSNGSPAEAQSSTIARQNPLTFGQDPNDLTNATGRLPNDRPHVFRTTGSVQLPWGFLVAGNLQVFSGRPWAETLQVSETAPGSSLCIPDVPAGPCPLRQGPRRILSEPRGARRLSSQKLFDLRVSNRLSAGPRSTVDLRLDFLNLLNDSAEESLVSDVIAEPKFGQPAKLNANFGKANVFMDPRRVMLSVVLNFAP